MLRNPNTKTKNGINNELKNKLMLHHILCLKKCRYFNRE